MSIKVSVAFLTVTLASGVAAAAVAPVSTPTLSSAASAASLSMSSPAARVDTSATLFSAKGSTPGSYDVKPTLGSLDQSFTLVGNALVGVSEGLSGRVTSLEAATTFPASLTATGTVSVANGGMSLKSYAAGLSLASLGLTFDTIQSTSTVGVGSAGLAASGNATIGGLRFTSSALFDTVKLNGLLATNAGANTVYALLPGLTLTLNEQLLSGNGTSALTRETNALHLAFNNFGFGTDIFNGSLILGHSEASISNYTPAVVAAVPEPASWAMMIAGFGATGAALRRTRRRAVVPAPN